MYTEGFEGLEEAEKESQKTFGASQDINRLIRENDKLKASLEKEKFFNKLLDQEIQELKTSLPNGHPSYDSEYWSGRKRVSRSAFFTLLFITLAMGAYIGYGIYYNKNFNYLSIGKYGISIAPSEKNTNSVTAVQPTNSIEQPNTNVEQTNANTADIPAGAQSEKQNLPASTRIPPPAVKDSVPNIIGSQKTEAAKQPQKQKAAVVITPDEEYNEEEVNAALREPVKPVTKPVNKPAVETAAAKTPPPANTEPATTTAVESRTVIGRYHIASKANFYNAPDENTMRSTFISGNKTVGALEEKNGFIFVEYTNDLGFTSKGWLSKRDLTKE